MERAVREATAEQARIYEVCSWMYHGAIDKVAQDLRARGITEQAIIHFRLGYDSGVTISKLAEIGTEREMQMASLINERGGSYLARRWVFPIFNEEGAVVGFTGRACSDRAKVKYLRTRDANKLMYNLPALRQREIYLTEGPMDVISLWQLGLNAAGLMGTRVPERYMEVLKKMDRVYVVLDGDDAGRAGAVKIAGEIGENAKILQLPEGEDANSKYVKCRGDLEEFLGTLNVKEA